MTHWHDNLGIGRVLQPNCIATSARECHCPFPISPEWRNAKQKGIQWSSININGAASERSSGNSCEIWCLFRLCHLAVLCSNSLSQIEWQPDERPDALLSAELLYKDQLPDFEISLNSLHIWYPISKCCGIDHGTIPNSDQDVHSQQNLQISHGCVPRHAQSQQGTT